MIQNFIKDPSARKDYEFDWTDWLNGDTISVSAWTVPSGLANYSDTHDSTSTTIWLAGGIAGTDYLVVNQITTTGGRIDQRTLKIQVREQ